jgi:hypothetical protein
MHKVHEVQLDIGRANIPKSHEVIKIPGIADAISSGTPSPPPFPLAWSRLLSFADSAQRSTQRWERMVRASPAEKIEHQRRGAAEVVAPMA